MKAFSTKNGFLMVVFCVCFFTLITSNSISTTCSITDQPLKIRSAAITNYKLDLNITWGGSDTDYGNSIALDPLGNIYITGETKSIGAGNSDAYITKYDSSGNYLFNITWGGSTIDYGRDIAINGTTDIYMIGSTYSFGAGGYDAFIAKYDTLGNSLLNITWGGNQIDYGYSTVFDNLGNIYITGDTASFGAGGYDAFIAKYDSSGNSLLNITWGGSQSDYGRDIALDDSGNIYIMGHTYSFGAGNSDVFIAKYDSLGTSLRNITWGGTGFDSGMGFSLDDLGNIYITGYTTSFGAGSYDAFIAKYDSLGNSVFNITWGTDKGDYGTKIALDSSRNIYMVGETKSYGAGNLDAFIAKYDSSGKSLLNITWGGKQIDKGANIILNGPRNIYITGRTESFGAGDYDAVIAKYIAPSRGIVVIGDDDDDDDDDAEESIPFGNIYLIFSLLAVASLIIIHWRKMNRDKR